MIQVLFNENEKDVTKTGLTQWDYGQELCVMGLKNVQNAEMHFAKDAYQEALIRRAKISEDTMIAKIPDELLKKSGRITVYIYTATKDEGKTIRTIRLPVKARERPEDYESPTDKNLLRMLIEELEEKADNLKIENGILQLFSGKKKIGEGVRIQSGESEIEFKNNGTAIQWRYTNSNEWKDLVLLSELTAKSPEFEIREGHLIIIYPE